MVQLLKLLTYLDRWCRECGCLHGTYS